MIRADELPEVLYHYCSAEAFHGIISSKAIWLSDLSQSNDSKEGAVAIEQICKELERRGVREANITEVRETYEKIASHGIWMGTSFSTHEDMLSQWRGYGDNGKGFALGLSKKWLLETSMLRPIYYEESEQQTLISKHLDVLAGSLDKAKGILQTMGQEILFQYKTPFFKEEGEIRLRYQYKKKDGDKELHFRTRGKSIVPYIKLPLLEGDSCIRKVWMGPKNDNPKIVTQTFLKNNGFNGVEIERSKGSYQ